MAEYISFQPSDSFEANLYTGTGSELAVTNVGFQSDITLLKERDGGNAWNLFDSVRGATKYLKTSGNNAEATDAQTLKSWQSTGYTVGTSAANNDSGALYVGYNWKAGTTSGIATNGSTTITPNSYSFNQTSGVSILQYTGNSTDDAKLAHGLGVAPHFVICKEQNVASNDWAVWHVSLGNNCLALNTTAAAVAGNSRFSDEAPDAVNITLGSDGSTNLSGNMICYAFAPIKGFSKFGQFIGNGNLDGPFCYTGFRPECILLKKSTGSAADWYIWDYERGLQGSDPGPLNPNTRILRPNENGDFLSGTNYHVDFLSNGFKWRTTSGNINNDDSTFVYAAFAKFPLVSSNDKPGLAR